MHCIHRSRHHTRMVPHINCLHAHIHDLLYIHTCIHTYTHIYVYTYITYTYTYTRTHTYKYMHYIYTYTHTYIHTYIHTFSGSIDQGIALHCSAHRNSEEIDMRNKRCLWSEGCTKTALFGEPRYLVL